MPHVTVPPLASTARTLHRSEVQLPGSADGRPLDSIVIAHEIRTISRVRLGRVHGRLDDLDLRAAI